MLFFLTMASSGQELDARVRALSAFLNRFPVKQYSAEFIAAADRFHLDWRLLPCLSIIESGGGKVAPSHNFFGWNSGRARFESAVEAIHTVASRLAQAPHYKGKSLVEKLKIYNPVDALYFSKVKKLMESLDRLHRSRPWEEASATPLVPDGGA